MTPGANLPTMAGRHAPDQWISQARHWLGVFTVSGHSACINVGIAKHCRSLGVECHAEDRGKLTWRTPWHRELPARIKFMVSSKKRSPLMLPAREKCSDW